MLATRLHVADRGSTLLEVMIASVVLAVAILGVLSAMSTSQVASAAAAEETAAMQLASARMEFLRTLAYQDLEAMAGDSTFEPGAVPGEAEGNGNGHAYAYGHLKGKNGALPSGSQVVTKENGMLVVTVTVTWSSRSAGREMSRSLSWKVAP